MDRGYIKLWRKLKDSVVFQNEGLLKVFIWCILKANHKETFVQIRTGRGTSEVKILPGTFIFGRDSAAIELCQNPSTVWKRMMKLKNLQILNIESNSHYSLIDIINWHIYQAELKNGDSESNRQVTGKEQASNTDNNDKNVKKNIYSADFDIFWEVYPKKKAKSEAWKAWQKQNGNRPVIVKLVEIIEKQKESKDWLKDNGQYIPYPATWINQQRWDDEVKTTDDDLFNQWVVK